MPNIMANIINIGIGQHNTSYVIYNIILMCGLTVLAVLGSIGSAYYAAKASGYASADIRKNVFEKITKLSFFILHFSSTPSPGQNLKSAWSKGRITRW